MSLDEQAARDKQDIEAIRKVVQAAHNYARDHCYGGAMQKLYQTTAAIKALERIEERLSPKQPALC